MTDEQKAALEWLVAVCPEYDCEAARHVRAIKAMLAEPRLPAEPTAEMLTAMYDGWAEEPVLTWRAAYRALYAHLTTPKTKTVEVWHVEFAASGNPVCYVYLTKGDADDEANALTACAAHTCIHVTGPHKQEVPND